MFHAIIALRLALKTLLYHISQTVSRRGKTTAKSTPFTEPHMRNSPWCGMVKAVKSVIFGIQSKPQYADELYVESLSPRFTFQYRELIFQSLEIIFQL